MTPRDPNVAKVELVAHVLGPLREQLVFVGGCATGLLISDPAAPPVRVTYDVDLTVQVAALSEYHCLEKKFAQLGFKRDLTTEVICRWHYQGLEVDLMPSDPAILGFANRWYPLVVQTARLVVLPSKTEIRLITAPAFLGTKFEAFVDRGKGDLLGSHDLEDIISVLDGRPELLQEIDFAPPELRRYLGERSRALLGAQNFIEFLPGMIVPDESLDRRVDMLAEKLRRIADFA